jgi:hypothetical protein
MIEPWNHPLSIWKTKSEYFVWLRGWLRRIWSDFPLRSEWKVTQLRPVTKEEREKKLFHTSTKMVGQCYLCKNWFPASKLECDHIQESGGCYDFETAEKFLWHCAADNPSNWALACQPCHKIKSHADRSGLSFEDAKIEKETIKIIKEKKDKSFLIAKGITPATNAKKRREQIKEYLTSIRDNLGDSNE